jgi:hypothetical protein
MLRVLFFRTKVSEIEQERELGLGFSKSALMATHTRCQQVCEGRTWNWVRGRGAGGSLGRF